MGIEIERKFLVKNNLWKTDAVTGTDFRQGYLSRGDLNIKSATLGIFRQEFEYPIPIEEARELLELFCSSTVYKKRYKVSYAGKIWEIDVFEQDNSGLVVAEIELNSVDEEFQLPSWIGDEVSTDTRYYNTELARHPYNTWDYVPD
jgi:adenylate cyclase